MDMLHVMLHLGISSTLDRHIMNRWERVTKYVMSSDMNFYCIDSLPVQSLKYRHRLLAASVA